jgi:hypothetical protein
MLVQCALTSKARGVVFLLSLGVSVLLTALMWDGLITELYGLAFGPLYVCLLIGFADTLTRVPRYTFTRDTYVPAPSPAAMVTRIGTFMVWVVLLVLLPLQIGGVETVDATAIAGVFVFWLLFVIAAQLRPDAMWLRPVSLRGIAEYLSAPLPEEILGREVEAIIELPEAPPNLEEDAFDQRLGTERHMSVSESLRGSPVRGDLSFLDDDSELGMPETEDNSVSASAVVYIPDRPAGERADFDPDDPAELQKAMLG